MLWRIESSTTRRMNPSLPYHRDLVGLFWGSLHTGPGAFRWLSGTLDCHSKPIMYVKTYTATQLLFHTEHEWTNELKNHWNHPISFDDKHVLCGLTDMHNRAEQRLHERPGWLDVITAWLLLCLHPSQINHAFPPHLVALYLHNDTAVINY